MPAPTTRSDFSTVGFTVTDRGEVWTMQEPYGAYSWYPANDQPSDKALYDISVTVPSPWTGVANGRLVETGTDESPDGAELTTTRWQLDEPASSYLVTVAIGDYTHRSNRTAGGLTIDYWIPRGLPTAYDDLKVAAKAVDWIEQRLGPYPFSSLGLVMTDSQSAMETQTMVTLGNSDYVRSAPVVLHEIVHQWYGDQVSPADWSDVWLNEGMTMLMQALYEADRGGYDVAQQVDEWRAQDQSAARHLRPARRLRPPAVRRLQHLLLPRGHVGRAAPRARRREVLRDRPLVAGGPRQLLGHATAGLRPLGGRERPRAVGLLRRVDHREPHPAGGLGCS